MPVEIRELLVKTTIEKSEGKSSGAAPSSGSGDSSSPSPAKNDTRAQDRLLKECVNIIMDNLSSFSKER